MTTPERKVPTMKREFVVTDEDGNISWNSDKDAAETFRTFKSAKARSVALAECAPGQSIRIYELTAETTANVERAVTSRKHPIEHYEA